MLVRCNMEWILESDYQYVIYKNTLKDVVEAGQMREDEN